ncbi:hypothetical protein Cs7R123_25810 [Catellatospora sp. TT07R-123]|uniref:CGNR zinc finger domain-containing protein n=1 Tax=Catellatospora sp. TT07R-123 TaxID=2733863 RepID=UPI001B1B8787|nr:CGNR zinc finger domain-containing protein [Catellatospora sp. TT07R-123]GHJ45239.1 hypothetical protein Cs7R123_25810 [Catellatospora sp. TT07R-123]
MTVGRSDITSQQTLDSYIEEHTALALYLINELALGQAFGRAVAASDLDVAAVNQALGVRATATRHQRWTPLDQPEAQKLAVAVRALRGAVDACVDGDVPTAARLLNELLERHRARPNLHGHPGGALVLAFHSPSSGPADARVADMATGLAMIIGTDRTARLGRCAAHGCERVFYDATRNGSRRFCGLTCQNRAKAASWRARRADEDRNTPRSGG